MTVLQVSQVSWFVVHVTQQTTSFFEADACI